MYACAGTNSDRAVHAVLASFALAHSLANEPVLISDLVRIACAAITVDSLQRVLSSQPLTDPQLKLLAERAAEAEGDGPTAFVRALGGGERCMAIDFFQMPASHAIQVLNQGGTAQQGPTFGLRLFRLLGIADQDFTFCLTTLGRQITAAQAPFPRSIELTKQANADLEKWMGSWSSRLFIVSRGLLPAMQKAFFKEARLTAQLRAARVGLAIERFRLAHAGELPARLEELCPEFLDAVPSDPFNGEPLQLEKLNPGYRVLCPAASQQEKVAPSTKGMKFVGFSVVR
jgi:hypothetical protein